MVASSTRPVHLVCIYFLVAFGAGGVDGGSGRTGDDVELLRRGAAAAAAAVRCESAYDCSYGGFCSNATKQCVCDPGFEGPTCAALGFKPASSAHPAAFRPGHGFTTWYDAPTKRNRGAHTHLFFSIYYFFFFLFLHFFFSFVFPFASFPSPPFVRTGFR